MSLRHVKLGDLGAWGSGGTPLASKPEYYGGHIPWLIIEDLNDDIVRRSARTITSAGLKNSSAKTIPPGTLLIAMYGSIGKLGITGMSCATNQAIAYCECDPSRVDTKFLFFLLLYERARFLRAGRGGTQQNISQEFLKDYEIQLPGLSEQKRIAGELEQANGLRRARCYTLELGDTFLPAVFLELFGDPRTNPKGLDRCTIDDVIEFSQYGTSQKSNSSKRGYPVLGMGNLTTSGEIDLSSLAYVDLTEREFEQLKLQRGDVIFNRTNSTELVGKTACWGLDLDATIASYLIRLRLKPNIVPEFFSALLNTAYFKILFRERCKKAVGQSNISPTLLKEFPIYVPPLALQQHFHALAVRREQLRVKQQETVRQADHLFQSLLSEAFAA